MAVGLIPMIVVSAFWGAIGIILPFLIPKGPNAGLIRLMLVLTACCCYLFWLCAYLSQINPLFGPSLHTSTITIMQKEWGAYHFVISPIDDGRYESSFFSRMK